jgi:hypothetical protein
MQTIGRHYHGPRYNYTDLCDYCGVPHHRSDLALNSEGKLYCLDNCANEAESLKDIMEACAANVGYIEPVRGKTREGPL